MGQAPCHGERTPLHGDAHRLTPPLPAPRPYFFRHKVGGGLGRRGRFRRLQTLKIIVVENAPPYPPRGHTLKIIVVENATPSGTCITLKMVVVENVPPSGTCITQEMIVVENAPPLPPSGTYTENDCRGERPPPLSPRGHTLKMIVVENAPPPFIILKYFSQFYKGGGRLQNVLPLIFSFFPHLQDFLFNIRTYIAYFYFTSFFPPRVGRWIFRTLLQ